MAFCIVMGGMVMFSQQSDFSTLDKCVEIANEVYDINDTEGRAKFLQSCVDN